MSEKLLTTYLLPASGRWLKSLAFGYLHIILFAYKGHLETVWSHVTLFPLSIEDHFCWVWSFFYFLEVVYLFIYLFIYCLLSLLAICSSSLTDLHKSTLIISQYFKTLALELPNQDRNVGIRWQLNPYKYGDKRQKFVSSSLPVSYLCSWK